MEDSPRRGGTKAVRVSVLILALVAMLALGITTPSANATALSRLVVGAFTFSLGIVLVSIIALMPSPMDSRDRVRRAFPGIERDSQGEGADAASADPGPGGPDRSLVEVYRTQDGDG